MTADQGLIAGAQAGKGLSVHSSFELGPSYEVLTGRSVAELGVRAHSEANPAGWLAWHLTRSHDSNMSEIAGREQVWVRSGSHEIFDRNADPTNTGFGHNQLQVDAFLPRGIAPILSYHDEVVEMVLEYLAEAPDADLGRLAPSPTLHTIATVQRRLVAVLNEGFQHLGQIRICQWATRP
jgi:DinB superfamily